LTGVASHAMMSAMTNDQRLDRLERMLEKCLRVEADSQRNKSETDAKIQILIDNQKRYEEQFGKITDRATKYDALFAMYHERLAKSDERYKKFDSKRIESKKSYRGLKESFSRTTIERTLNIKPEINYIAFLHDVVLPFQS
jgi:hypothetical protein